MANFNKIIDTPHVDETPVVEIFGMKITNESTNNITDIEGYGLIITLHKGNREWLKTSVSKTPMSFLNKQLDDLKQSSYATHALIIRGTVDYPLTDKEIKNISGKISKYLHETNVAPFTSYSTISTEDSHTEQITNNVLQDVINLITTYGYDTTIIEKPENLPSIVSSEPISGTQEITVNGVTIIIKTKLTNENNPDEGYDNITINVNNPTGKPLLTASTYTN